MVTEMLTVADLERSVNDVLERVRRGEHISTERDGEVIAIIEPVRTKPGITARELVAQVGNLKFPGDGFGDDLEAVQSAQPLAKMPEWPD